MERSCVRCGETFEAARGRSARFCSDTCRTAARRARDAGQPEALPDVPEVVVHLPSSGPAPEGLAASTRRELEKAGRLDSWQGQAALALAILIDDSHAVMGYAALVREHRQAMTEALRNVDTSRDALDEIEQAALRILRGA